MKNHPITRIGYSRGFMFIHSLIKLLQMRLPSLNLSFLWMFRISMTKINQSLRVSSIEYLFQHGHPCPRRLSSLDLSFLRRRESSLILKIFCFFVLLTVSSFSFSDTVNICNLSPAVKKAIFDTDTQPNRQCETYNTELLSRILNLDLSGTNISNLKPEDFTFLTNLQRVNLSGNQLESLPEKLFEKNTKLTTVNLSGNKLSNLPENLFSENTPITDINLSNNQLSQLTAKLCNHTQLENLDLSGNQLNGGDINNARLNQCENLKILNLANNQITNPEQLNQKLCKADNTQLQELDLGGNTLGQTPSELCTQCQKLTKLKLNNTNIADNDSLGTLEQCKELTELNLRGNQITEVPQICSEGTKLKNIDLEENQLTTLPGNICEKCIKLTELNLNNNQITSTNSDQCQVKTLSTQVDGVTTDVSHQLMIGANTATLELARNPMTETEARSVECDTQCQLRKILEDLGVPTDRRENILARLTDPSETPEEDAEPRRRGSNEPEEEDDDDDEGDDNDEGDDDDDEDKKKKKDKNINDQALVNDLMDCHQQQNLWGKLSQANVGLCTSLQQLFQQKNENARMQMYMQQVQPQLWDTVQQQQLQPQAFSMQPSLQQLGQPQTLRSPLARQNLMFMNYINDMQYRVGSIYQGVQRRSLNARFGGLTQRVDSLLRQSTQGESIDPYVYHTLSNDLLGFQNQLSGIRVN